MVYLSATFPTLARRIGLDRDRVVIPGNPRGRLRAMRDSRTLLYQRLAAVTVPTDDLEPDELAAEIAAAVTAPAARDSASYDSASYDSASHDSASRNSEDSR